MSRNLLLGRGHALTKPFKYRPGSRPKSKHPYEFAASKERLRQRVSVTQERAKKLTEPQCPNGRAVVGVTLHPEYLAKSHSPEAMLSEMDGRIIGSRGRPIAPQSTGEVETCPELIVSAPVDRLKNLTAYVDSIVPESDAANDFRKVEDFRLQTGHEKTAGEATQTARVWEMVLHANSSPEDSGIIESFIQFALTQFNEELEVDKDRLFFAGGLCFLPVRATTDGITALAEFSFVRCVRLAPRIRGVRRTFGGEQTIECNLPDAAAIDSARRLLVIDGGRVASPFLDKWVTDLHYDGIGDPDPDYEDHGLAVLSASLFGSCTPSPQRPFCRVDNIRVFDTNSGVNNDYEYFDVLARIRNVVIEYGDRYDFMCLCSGPDMAIEDGEPSAWTAVLDQVCGRSRSELFCAPGNGGQLDADAGLNRIQPPSDGCNITAVGSSTGTEKNWRRAVYSSVGRGRQPGYVKPEFVVNGGELPHDPFYVVGTAEGTAIPKQGTSFSAPSAARTAAAIRAAFGEQISPLAVRALMINRSDPGQNSQVDVGWGRVSSGDLISTDDNEVIVVYEGKLIPNQWREARLPVPDEALPGQIEIAATFCFKTETDPHHPLNYTRTGLNVVFRPHAAKYDFDDNGKKSQRPTRGDFFTPKDMYNLESKLRREAMKWESVLHRTKRPYGSSLYRPTLDINYMTRRGSSSGANPEASPIPYALVVRLKSTQEPDLYNKVVRQFQQVLLPMNSVIELPIRVA